MCEIKFTPELPIGTEFYIMKNNRATLGLIAEINVRITICTIHGKSWHEQLFKRSKKQRKEIFRCSYDYGIKLEDEIVRMSINKQGNDWYLYDEKIYFSLEELKASI
jgi:hypothetical protein